MDASDIIRLLQTSHYSPADLEEVNKVCRNNPEFTAAHLLKVRIMEALGYDKQKQLKIAAVYSMDRTKLFQLVTGVVQPAGKEAELETDSGDPTSEIIHFSDEPHLNADIIIDQHAPYASQSPDAELLELEEEPSGELLEIIDDNIEVPADEAAPEDIDEAPFEPDDTDDLEQVDDSKEVVDTEVDVDAEEDDDTEEDRDAEEENDAELLLRDLEKDETEMEEPGQSDDQVPSIDRVDRDSDEINNNHLITRFIKDDPGPIRADRETSLKGDVSLDSIREHDGFITDTLARIYVKQGLLAKAIYAYERLSLKYPEKSAYFAAQIDKIKNINHS